MSEWKMVPVEPTVKMQNAGWRDADAQGIEPEDLEILPIWKAMLAAAPAPAFDEAAERAAAHQSFEEQMPIMCSLDEFTAGYLACAKRKAGGDL